MLGVFGLMIPPSQRGPQYLIFRRQCFSYTCRYISLGPLRLLGGPSALQRSSRAPGAWDLRGAPGAWGLLSVRGASFLRHQDAQLQLLLQQQQQEAAYQLSRGALWHIWNPPGILFASRR